MSWLSKMFSGAVDDFKRRMREWCRTPAAVTAVLAYPPLAEKLAALPPEAQAEVRAAVPLVLEAMADKWFGG